AEPEGDVVAGGVVAPGARHAGAAVQLRDRLEHLEVVLDLLPRDGFDDLANVVVLGMCADRGGGDRGERHCGGDRADQACTQAGTHDCSSEQWGVTRVGSARSPNLLKNRGMGEMAESIC